MNNYVITIGRGYGSGGRTIGKMLADKLGINYYDKEIMRLASKESGINQQFFAMADEKLKQTNIFKVSQNVYRGETFSDVDQISNTELFNYQARVLRELATRESFVIMGRCADFVLKDYKNVTKVFVHASIDKCVKNVSSMSSMTEEELKKFIMQTDYQRSQYYRFHTGREWSDARNYDICLNTDGMTLDNCVETINNYRKMKGTL
ncbi:AAA family ATPase [Lachnospiraceae bacterium HCP1S3_C3]|nr:cytidylate kinase-like family protein [Lachnospiraceae bacterium]